MKKGRESTAKEWKEKHSEDPSPSAFLFNQNNPNGKKTDEN